MRDKVPPKAQTPFPFTPSQPRLARRSFTVKPVPEIATSQAPPDLQTQLERAERFGHNFGNIPRFAPGTQSPPPPVIQSQLTIRQLRVPDEQSAAPSSSLPTIPLSAESHEGSSERETQPSEESKSPLADYMRRVAQAGPQEQSIQRKFLWQISAQSAENHQGSSRVESQPSYSHSGEIGLPEAISPLSIQTKLTVGAPGDKYEQEADRVAAQVMRMSAPPVTPTVPPQAEEEEQADIQTKPLAATITPLVQRQEELGNEETVQAKCEVCEQEEQVQRSSGDVVQAQPDLETQLNSSKGGGSPLLDEVRSFMEPRFGTDFSGVRVHTGNKAVQMNRELGAQAFAHGSDVYFGAGKSPGNNELTAHELTHVVQQTGGSKIQRQPSPVPAPAPGVFPPTSSAPPPQLPQSESERIISNIHGLGMKKMLENLSALDKTRLKDTLNIVDRVPGIDVARTRIAIEAVLGMKFSQSSINWLDKNSSTGGFSDQVIEIRDFMKPDAFDQSASTLLAKVTQQIQQSYQKAIQNNQTNAKDSVKTTSTPALPAEAQKDLEKLKILSSLAAIQLQAVINAQGYLSMSDSTAHDAVSKAAGLTSDQEWCGGFAVTNYIPLQLSAQLKGVFWSTPKLLDFFTYQHGYDPYRWIHVGDEYPEVKTYHEKSGSLRKWLTGDQIHAGGELDIRPGDIVLQDNRYDTKADHIQTVQSWEPATQTLFTIDGNGGGYQVDNRPIAKANKDKPKPDDEKQKVVETATGYRLRSGSGGGVVGLGSYNLSAEPTEQEVKESRQKGKKIVRIVGIGRPSVVDFETHSYLTKLPPKAKKPSKAKKP